jgi:uncharacterized membrane protein YfcA
MRRGLVHRRAALIIGVVSIGGVVAGAALAESLSDSTLRRAFGVFLLLTAAQMAWRVRPGRTTERRR